MHLGKVSIIIILLSTLFYRNVGAQSSLEITYKGKLLKQKDTLTFEALNNLTAIHDIKVINKSGSLKKVKCKKIELSLASSSKVAMCWAGQCYTPSIFITPSTAKMNSGDTATDFVGDYYAKGNKGISFIEFVFFDTDNNQDSSSFVAKFDGLRLSTSQLETEAQIEVYPNPVSEFLYVKKVNSNNSKDLTIELFDLKGRSLNIKANRLDNSTYTLSIRHLIAGYYFLKISDNNNYNQVKKVLKH